MKHYVAINCTAVSLPLCPVEDTIYGYRPSLGLNAFFIALFALVAAANILLAIKYKTYFFGFALAFGCTGEAIGYGGRIIMNNNPYDNLGFTMQIACLIFSPAFVAAAIYLTLKHIIITFGPSKSRIPAYLYTWIFISCDFISLLLQAIGGGMAGSAHGENKKLNLGTNLMIAGIVWQVATLFVFSTLVVDFVVRIRRDWGSVPDSAKVLAQRMSFKIFAWGVVVAFTAVMLRCIYRITEMAGGWANPIMRDQPSFAVMEGFMIVVAVSALTVFHPGYSFPQLSNRVKNAHSIEAGNGSSYTVDKFQRSEAVSSSGE